MEKQQKEKLTAAHAAACVASIDDAARAAARATAWAADAANAAWATAWAVAVAAAVDAGFGGVGVGGAAAVSAAEYKWVCEKLIELLEKLDDEEDIKITKDGFKTNQKNWDGGLNLV
jgi:hypothetical protein